MFYLRVLAFLETCFCMWSAVAVLVINIPREVSLFGKLWAALPFVVPRNGYWEIKKNKSFFSKLTEADEMAELKENLYAKKKKESDTSKLFLASLCTPLVCQGTFAVLRVSCLMQLQAQNHAVPQLPPQTLSTLRAQRSWVTAG